MRISTSSLAVSAWCNFGSVVLVNSARMLIATMVFTGIVSAQTIQFSTDIRPIFNEHCVACHGGVKQAGDVSFVYRESALQAIEPGSPEDSTLLDRVTSTDPEEQMPPPEHGARLKDAEIELLRKWVAEGAKWNEHWSFEPPKRSDELPTTSIAWGNSRIDTFVLAEMQKHELSPSTESAPDQWLRRVSFDLTGLPPLPEARDAFLKLVEIEGEQAYQNKVDELLASTNYGERWASVWLDVVRYADSKGLGLDGRRSVWMYRDWVIRAFNQDMPYDEFTVKQLAGDLLPNPSFDDLIATACQRLTQSNEEGGTDDEQFRVEAVLDRANTTWQAWSGITFACVQCHSHPYEPIEHEEYYKFAAFYNNTMDCDLDEDWPVVRVPVDRTKWAESEQLDKSLREIRKEVWNEGRHFLEDKSLWLSLSGMKVTTNNSTQAVVKSTDQGEEFQTVGTVARNTTFAVDLPESVRSLSAFKFTGLPENEERALKDSEWGFILSFVEAEVVDQSGQTVQKLEISYVISDEFEPFIDPQLSLDTKRSMGFGPYTRMNYPRTAVFVMKNPVAVDAAQHIRISLRQSLYILSAFPLVTHRGRIEVTGDPRVCEWVNSERWTKRNEQLTSLEKQRREIEGVDTPVMADRPPEVARKSYLFIRGNYLAKDKEVSPSTPAFLPELGDNDEVVNRLDMAKWLTSSDNPLTARVMVNRIWAQLFGIGIVETQEDFGSSGEPPSHPELLDDLSVRFVVDMKWSLKSLLREVVLSKTYRQSNRVTPELLEKDPRNRLLARGPRNRLTAEMVRDQSLAAAGLLVNKQFGRPVNPPIPPGVWTPFESGDKWQTPEVGAEDRYRRTVYTYTKRSIPYPIMSTFDAPSREFCSSRRLSSNTPIQALLMLNDEVFQEAATGLANRMLNFSDDPETQINFGFTVVTTCQPTQQQSTLLADLYASLLSDCRKASEQSSDAAVTDSSPSTDADTSKANNEEAMRLEAMTAVASALLNLDQSLTR